MADFISDEEMSKLQPDDEIISDEQMSAMESSQPSKLESGALGAVDSASLGFADEIYGGVKGGLQALTGPRDFADTYEEARNEARDKFKNAEQANPGSYLTGQLGGGLATALIPGVGLAKGAGLAANVARGAALGGTAGIGASTSDDFTKDALLGAGLGAAGGAVAGSIPKIAESAGKGLSKLSGKLDDTVEQMGRNALGGTLAESRKFAPGVGKQMFEEGYVTPFASKEEIAKRLGSKVGNLADENASLVGSIENQSARLETSEMLNSAKQRIADLYEAGEYNKAEALEKLYSNLKSKIPSSVKPSVFETIKRDSQKAFETTASSAAKEAGRDMATIQRESLETGLKGIAPEIGEQYASRNQQMSRLIPALDAAEGAAEKESRQSIGRFLDPQRVGPELYKSTLGPQKVGWALNKLSNAVNAAPQNFGRFAPVLQQAAQRGNHSLAVTNYLLQQKEPEYREQIRLLESEDER